jgi:molecular chaperone DnaK (HSP70)
MEDTQEKVPSAIYYNEKGEIRWGFDIPPEAENTIRWMKLLLEPDLESLKNKVAQESHEVTKARKILQKLEKTELDVVSDYLRCLWEHVQKQIIKEIGSVAFERAAKTIILTIPAIWSDKAAHNTNTAAVNAGLANKNHALLVVTEPQAAAVEVLRRNVKVSVPQDDNPNIEKKDSCYVICDAGGGTVVSSTYHIIVYAKHDPGPY